MHLQLASNKTLRGGRAVSGAGLAGRASLRLEKGTGCKQFAGQELSVHSNCIRLSSRTAVPAKVPVHLQPLGRGCSKLLPEAKNVLNKPKGTCNPNSQAGTDDLYLEV